MPTVVTSFQMLLGFSFAPSESAGYRPDAARGERVLQHGMRHQPRHPTVTVGERMDPEKSMVGGGGGYDGVNRPEPCIGLLKPFHEARHGGGADRHIPTDGHFGRAELARKNRNSRTIGVRDPQEIVGQQGTEPTMDLTDPRREMPWPLWWPVACLP